VNDADGSMARCPALLAFGKTHGLKVMLISDLIRYRRAREAQVERTAVARLPTAWGAFSAYSYRSHLDGIEHVAMVMGDIGDGANVLTRVHSECLTGDIFASARCDCGPQLSAAMARVAKEGRGVIVYLRGQEGRGIGLGHKLRAYNLQDNGRDTVQANEDLGLPVDSREYGIGAQILRDIGVRSLRLMTNNPAKYSGLRGHGLTVVGRVPLLTPINPENRRYIETKREKMGHYAGDELVMPEDATTAGAGSAAQ
jgi:3,4-dihydroxy 2-butanone 4-phosphate synthase/GTP cyclohydrolase II